MVLVVEMVDVMVDNVLTFQELNQNHLYLYQMDADIINLGHRLDLESIQVRLNYIGHY